jgi:transitional endoplasmic reticulum ATPase
MSGVGKATFSFFGTTPPMRRTINITPTETLDVPWGEVRVDLFEADMTLGGEHDEELGLVFSLAAYAPKKNRTAIEGFFRVIEDELEQRSIYRGRAFDGKEMPDFISLDGVDPKRVVYSEEVYEQLEANLWTLLEQTQVNRDLGLPLKRAVLLHGEYGTGKTLAAYLTGQKAIANGWTFVYCRPGKDDLNYVFQTARLYQPAVVFFEDVDTISEPGDGQDAVTTLLDTFDGVAAKGTEILAILTTNHVDRIHKGMVRPGRLDAIIEISSLDSVGVRKLIIANLPESMLGDWLDWDAIGEAMDAFTPAFVKEAGDRTVRYAITREGGIPDRLETEDFLRSARGMTAHLDLMESALDSIASDPLGATMRREITAAVKEIDYYNGKVGVIRPVTDE